MQYILSEDEYKDLVRKSEIRKKDCELVIQDLCTKVANNMPVAWSWGDYFEPWGCVLTKESHDEWYCDECPVQKECPSKLKKYSK